MLGDGIETIKKSKDGNISSSKRKSLLMRIDENYKWTKYILKEYSYEYIKEN